MLKKRIVLVNPPGNKLYSRDKYCNSVSKANYYWVPVDLLIISGILGEKYDLKIIDAIIEKKNIKDVCNEIIKYNPEVVISLTSNATWDIDFKFLREVKKNINVKIVLSGGIVLTKSKFILTNYEFIDACLLDFTTREISNYIENNGEIYNMVYRDKEAIVESKRKVEENFCYPIPKHELFKIRKYHYPIGIFHPSTCIITSLGCPYKCSFCVPSTIQYRTRDIENVINELKYIQSLGIKEVVFQDSTFSFNKEYVKRLCNEMLSNGIKLSWICLTRVDCVDENLLMLMKKTGCHSIEFGVESGDDSILKSISKGITKDDVKKTFNICAKIGIKTCAFFILGLPGQDVKSIENTIKFAIEINPDKVSFSLPMPHYGTKFGNEIIANNNRMHEFNDIQISKDVNTDIDAKKLIKLRNKAYVKFYFRPNYIIRQVISIESVYQFKLMLKEFFSLLSKYVFALNND